MDIRFLGFDAPLLHNLHHMLDSADAGAPPPTSSTPRPWRPPPPTSRLLRVRDRHAGAQVRRHPGAGGGRQRAPHQRRAAAGGGGGGQVPEDGAARGEVHEEVRSAGEREPG